MLKLTEWVKYNSDAGLHGSVGLRKTVERRRQVQRSRLPEEGKRSRSEEGSSGAVAAAPTSTDNHLHNKPGRWRRVAERSTSTFSARAACDVATRRRRSRSQNREREAKERRRRKHKGEGDFHGPTG